MTPIRRPIGQQDPQIHRPIRQQVPQIHRPTGQQHPRHIYTGPLVNRIHNSFLPVHWVVGSTAHIPRPIGQQDPQIHRPIGYQDARHIHVHTGQLGSRIHKSTGPLVSRIHGTYPPINGTYLAAASSMPRPWPLQSRPITYRNITSVTPKKTLQHGLHTQKEPLSWTGCTLIKTSQHGHGTWA